MPPQINISPSRCPARADGHGIDGRLTGRRHVADPSSKPNEADDGTNGHRSLRQGLQDRKGHALTTVVT